MDNLHEKRQNAAQAELPAPITRQAERHAEEAKEKVAQRRSKQSGAAGWISERASQWTLVGSYFRRMGVLPAAPDSITAALAAGEDVALWPGGERDSLRPWTKRDQAELAGRTGFIKLAIRSGVPIVPIATVGGPDSMPVLATGRRLAKLLQLDKLARLKMFPIAIQVPWGVSPALLPEVPLPTKIRTAFQEPIALDRDPARAHDDDYVERVYEQVQSSIQAGMDTLARRRRLPLFG